MNQPTCALALLFRTPTVQPSINQGVQLHSLILAWHAQGGTRKHWIWLISILTAVKPRNTDTCSWSRLWFLCQYRFQVEIRREASCSINMTKKEVSCRFPYEFYHHLKFQAMDSCCRAYISVSLMWHFCQMFTPLTLWRHCLWVAGLRPFNSKTLQNTICARIVWNALLILCFIKDIC